MATTTNYGWTTPDDTALVKDGAAAIRTLGSSVDTTTKNLNPETTLADIAYRSSTANVNTRLGIGTTGQVLTVAGGVPTWATPASGGRTLITSGSLSGATVTLSAIPGTHQALLLRIIKPQIATSAGGVYLQLNGVTSSTYSATWTRTSSSSLLNGAGSSSVRISDLDALTSGSVSYGEVYLPAYAVSGIETGGQTFAVSNNDDCAGSGTFYNGAITSAITSITILHNGVGNFNSGTYELYGVN